LPVFKRMNDGLAQLGMLAKTQGSKPVEIPGNGAGRRQLGRLLGHHTAPFFSIVGSVAVHAVNVNSYIAIGFHEYKKATWLSARRLMMECGAARGGSVFAPQMREKNHVANAGAVGEQHDQAVDADAAA